MVFKIVIFVTSGQATVGRWRLGKLVSCETFPNSESGHDQFHLFLQRHLNTPVWVIVDAVEEDFRLESMPHARGSARGEMVERKLNQLYRNSSYRTAQFIARENDKRRDDRFLLMALTNSDMLTPWMSAIESLQVPLAGVYLKASVSQLLVKALKLKSADLLLMTRQSAGLRQTYFSNQLLRVSRLTPLAGMDARQIEKLYITETEKTLLYLISLRMMSRDTKLHLVFPTTEPINEALTNQLGAGHGVECSIIGYEKLAHIVGLDTGWLKRFPDLLDMHLLARFKCPGNLAPPQQTWRNRLHNLQVGINIASFGMVTAALVIAISNLTGMANLNDQRRLAAEQTRHQERLYEEVSRNFPQTPLPGNDLKVAVELSDKINKINCDPQRMMQVLSTVLDIQYDIRLTRLHWMLTENAAVRDDAGKGNMEKGNGDDPPPPSPNGLYEIGFIDGEISNFTGDYRAALESVNQLVENLRKNAEVQKVTMLQLPFNTSSLANLQGSTLEQRSQQMPTAVFRIKIILKSGEKS